MKKRSKKFYSELSRRVGSVALSIAMVAGNLYVQPLTASAAEAATGTSWKSDVLNAIQDVKTGEEGLTAYTEAQEALQTAYDSLESSKSVEGLTVTEVGTDYIVLEWLAFESDALVGYNVYWADSNTDTTIFQLLDKDSNNCFDDKVVTIASEDVAGQNVITFKVKMSTNQNHYFKVAPVTTVGVGGKCEAVMSPTAVAYTTKLEEIGRGLTVTMTSKGAFLNWRLLGSEVDGYSKTGLTGLNFNVYRNGEKIATVTDSTNYLDTAYTGALGADTYKLVPVDKNGVELGNMAVTTYDIFTSDSANADVAYLDIPLQKPADTTIKETYGVDSIALGGYTWTDGGYTSADDKITYSANDMSVADVDGDGEYEYLVKWDPSLSKDVSQQGYTGKAYIDCYELDGTILWRLDLGLNIRAGAHYTQFGVYDYDGDGKAEMMVKTAPGSKMIKYAIGADGKNIMDGSVPKVASEDYVDISAEDQAAGVKDSDNYVMSAAGYREYLIELFQDWGVWSRFSEETVKNAIAGHWSGNLVTMFTTSEKWSDKTFFTGEVVSSANKTLTMGTATVDDIKQYIPDYKEGDALVNVALRDDQGQVKYTGGAGTIAALKTVKVEEVADYYGNYDLASVNFDATGKGYTKEQATILADYFLQHYQYRMKKHNLNVWEGYVITGPEYITLFDCETGAELDTQDWFYGREDDGMLWGDYAMNYIEPGNRVDRFNVAIAYLDGETPSCVMGRGYYTRTTLAAYTVVDKKLKMTGNIDSGWTVMTNPFNDGPHGMDGCDPENGTLAGQGNHQIVIADVDGNGTQELINGGAIISYKNGQMYLYSSGGGYCATTDSWAKYGHGDMLHVTDIDPDHPGLEIASCFEGGAWAPYDWAIRDAKSNTALFGAPGSRDHGRTSIGDFNTSVRGIESTEGYDCKGNALSAAGTSTNMNIKWKADMSTQFVSGTTNTSIIGQVDGKSVTYLNAPGYATNNSTKGNPSLVADLFGDYREEIILHDADSTHLRIFMNTEVSAHKNYTLMHNAQYRVGIASQNSAYNVPSYTDYYYASDTDWSRVMVPNKPSDQEPGIVIAQPANVTLNITSKTLFQGDTLQLTTTVVPSNADQTIVWSVDEAGAGVVSVSESGLVTALKSGTAYVTATTVNGKTCTCKVSVIGKYEQAGLDKMQIGDSYTFKFGTTAAASVDTQRNVTKATAYSTEAGYGWLTAAKVEFTDGADYVAANNYRAVDASGNVTYEYPTFVVDVPVGIYDVKVVQGTNGTDKAVNGAYVEGYMYASRWSTESFATSFAEPTEGSWIWTEAGKTKEATTTVAVADGQLTINLATWLKDDNTSGTTYVKEIVVTRKEQNTAHSEKPTLRFIGDSTLAKYPPEDGGTWTPIPERTGWGEDFSMGKFVDEDVVLVNKAVAGSSLKSYIYDGYYNDFFLNSRPGDTVIIESGINDSAAGRRYSSADDFEAGLRYLIKSCQAFGLDVIISSGTSSSTTYTEKMAKLAEEFKLPYVDLLGLWANYLTKVGNPNLTVDGTHLKRIGGIVAAQLVANEIADIDGLYISGHVKAVPMNYEIPTAKVTGVYAKAQTENSITLAWSIDEELLYETEQFITDFNIYRKAKASDAGEKIGVQTAYVSAGMNGPQLYTTLEAPATGTYYYYVTCQGVTGEGPASAEVQIPAFTPDANYTLSSLIEQYNNIQMNDASAYTVESYAALKVALAEGEAVLADSSAAEDVVKAALAAVEEKITALKLNATELVKTDFQNEKLTTAPWGVTGNQKTLMSAIMDTDGNRMLKLYVEAAGNRYVKKVFDGAANVDAALEMFEFEWYPGNPDRRNVTEVEFLSTDTNRVLSLKTSSNGHIGYVTGNYPGNSTAYMTGDGFHAYEGSKAVDLGLTNEIWYNVKIVFNFADGTADLYLVPRDDASKESKVVKGIAIDAAGSNTITTMNYLLQRGKQDNGETNDLSILWDTRFDNYAVYYANAKSTADAAAYETALAAYKAAVAGLSSAAMADEKIVLAEAVVAIMEQNVGFFTADDYAYAVSVLKEATDAAPPVVLTTSMKVKAEADTMVAGTTQKLAAELSEGANEEVVWTSADETIATVEGTGTSAVVTALKAGTVKITASGATSKVAGSIDLTVTGQVYFFGSDVTEESVYNAETGYGFVDYTYPVAAKGWQNGVFYARELVEAPGVSYINAQESAEDYLAVMGQVWTELHEGGRDEDTITYENTNAFVIDRENGNYTIAVTFYNPNKTTMNVMVKAEDIRRYDFGDHATAQLGQATIAGGQTATVVFDLALTDEQITLRFEQNAVAASSDTAGARSVYVKSVSVDKAQSEAVAKTTIYTLGDSTVQSYIKANYRNGWGQLLYTLFGSEVNKKESDTGYAYYETADTIVRNYARDGRSAKSLLEEGRFNEVLLGLQEGDYVFLQTAHNDDNQARPNRFLSVAEYKQYLEAYNKAITERGATLVLVTPIVLNVWEADGSLDHRFDDYRLGMMQVAEKCDIPVLDLMGSTLELVSAMGKDNVAALNMYMSDAVHTQPVGAQMFTKLLGNLLNASTDAKLADVKKLMDYAATENSITLTCDETMYIGDNGTVQAIAADTNAKVTIYSSDESVVRLEGGKLVAAGVGQAIITAGYIVGNPATADCTAYTAYKVVTVTDNAADEAFQASALVAETVSVDMPVLASEADEIKVQTLSADGGVVAGNVTVYTNAAVDGKQPSPLADYQFDLGARKGAAGAPFKTVSGSALEYTSDKGYGFIGDVAGVTPDKHDDTSLIFTPSNEYETALMAAISDGARAGEWQFAIDLPAGEYCITMYAYDTWNGASANATYYINDVQVGTYKFEKGVAKTPEQIAMSGRVVLAEDGQVVLKGVKGTSALSYINAITVNEYVEKIDPFNANAWEKADEALAALEMKANMFADDSTPFDYDVILVNKMVAAKEALNGVAYMTLADTTSGDELYALAEEAVTNKLLYTEVTMAALEAAMADYVDAKNGLDIKATTRNARDVIEFWLQGVQTEYDVEPYAGYYDFNTTQTGRNYSCNDNLAWKAAGWTPVGVVDKHPSLDLYSVEKGYGVLGSYEGRNRGIADLMLTDWAPAGTIFKVDLPAGNYKVIAYSGDILDRCKAPSQFDFYVDYVDATNVGTNIASVEKLTAPNAGYLVRNVEFTLEEAKTVTMVSGGYVNGVIFEQYIPAVVERFDVTELAAKVAQINEAAPVETDYTISSWAAFKTAYDIAVKAVETGASYAQQIATVQSNLEKAFAGLTQRSAAVSYVIDFGPEQESEEVPGKVAAAALISGFLPADVTLKDNVPELGLKNMLYEANSNDDSMHYGFTSEVASGFTATGGAYFRDWVYGEGGNAYTFKADVLAGKYLVYVYTGCKEANNVTKFYFNNGEAALDSTNTAVNENAEGKTVYTQSSNAGGQFATPGCIYTVNVPASNDALGYAKGAEMGVFSLTLFDDDPTLAADAITARLCGIELVRIGDAENSGDIGGGDVSGGDVSGGDIGGGDVSGGDVSGGDVSGGDVGGETADFTILKITFDKAASLDAGEYTSASYAVLEEALAAAAEVLANENAAQAEVDAAVEVLNQALAALVKKADFTALDGAIKRAEILSENLYTPESYAAVVAALGNAKAVAENETAAQAEVDAAVEALNNAIAALIDVTVYNALVNAVNKAEKLDSSAYTEGSYATVVSALNTAKAVLADSAATQEAMQGVTKVLNDAIAALVKKPVEPESPAESDDTDDAGSASGSTESEPEVDWNQVAVEVKQQAPAQNAGTNLDVVAGNNIVVPSSTLASLSEKKQGKENVTLALHTGNGVTFSLSSTNVTANANKNMNLSVRDGQLNVPAAQVTEKTRNTITNKQISMADHGSFGMVVNLHLNMGAENSGKFANLYRYNDVNGRLEYAGSFQIVKNGQAMFGLTKGAEYLVTVTNAKPNERVTAADGTAYKVQRGDSVSKIAARYGMSISQLLALNPEIRDANKILAGQNIKVK